MLQTEDPPGLLSTILLSYDKIQNDPHPVTISLYANNIKRTVNYTIKVRLTIENLKQELRDSLKSGRKYDYENDCIKVSLK